MSGRSRAARERADTLFGLYFQLGAERSLRRLHELTETLGINISFGTLKRYSTRFGWQERAAELSATAADRQDELSLREVIEMNERQAQLGRTLQGAAASGLQALLRDHERIADVPPSGIARLAEIGARLERLALGEATERQDVLVVVWNVVVREVVALFQDTNELPDPDERAAVFARGVDGIVDRHLIGDGSVR